MVLTLVRDKYDQRVTLITFERIEGPNFLKLTMRDNITYLGTIERPKVQFSFLSLEEFIKCCGVFNL